MAFVQDQCFRRSKSHAHFSKRFPQPGIWRVYANSRLVRRGRQIRFKAPAWLTHAARQAGAHKSLGDMRDLNFAPVEIGALQQNTWFMGAAFGQKSIASERRKAELVV
ncbi:hypothetical protein NP590_10555 [Methylomonas sp. SURF-2]|uniref:Uncharacterized protein n=1 Tax=Methylomonas subterranea TaxID=2952225 RepID=A0ABT1TGF9_9GAMM|nr:hypothetical protein [Methylomonas sp. SURF-2]MCQ8104545.1 hypothetical protein [Methylomonas sp. SURF-2]